jgi:hypothetical protein
MDKREAGKQRTEQFVTELVRNLKLEGSVGAYLWWPSGPSKPGDPERPDDTTVPFRIYKGNNWRAIEFAASDVDASVDDPEVLRKYEGEIAQSLAEL